MARLLEPLMVVHMNLTTQPTFIGRRFSSGQVSVGYSKEADECTKEVIHDTLKAIKDDNKRLLGELVMYYPDIVLHQPEMHEYLDRLVKSDSAAVCRILDIDGRGAGRRPQNQLYLVSFVEELIQAQGTSAAKAAEATEKRLRNKKGYDTVDSRRLRTLHSKLQHHLHRVCAGHFAAAGSLTREPWRHPRELSNSTAGGSNPSFSSGSSKPSDGSKKTGGDSSKTGGWPSKSGNPSGGGRTNAPPRK